MSHFTVVVIGEDPDAQLAPYDETLEVEPYPDPISIEPREAGEGSFFARDGVAPAWEIQWACSEYLQRKWKLEDYEETKTRIRDNVDAAIDALPFDPFNLTEKDAPEVAKLLNEVNGPYEDYDYNEEDGLHRLTQYNPESKWDWYVIGGRWRGFFRVKDEIPEEVVLGRRGVFGGDKPQGEGKRADQLMVGSIDFESMRQDAAVEAHKSFDVWQEVLDSATITIDDIENAKPWSDFADKSKEEEDYSLDEARADYAAQPIIKEATRLAEEYREADDDKHWLLKPIFSCPIKSFGFDRQEYAEKAKRSVAVPYALVKDGRWHEKGEMGWFGMAKNEMSQDDWNDFVYKTYENLKPTTLVTLIDAHI